jgi:arylsulfatase B
MATERHTPLGRGYETWLGYFGHCNDYWNQIDKCGMGSCGSVAMVDLWEQNRSAANPSHPAKHLNNSQSCSQQEQQGCTFEDDLFLQRALRVVRNHNASAPLYLFWAMHACHGPRQVPDWMLNHFAFIDDHRRRMYAALASYLDQMVGTLVAELQAAKLYDQTLILFASDNGGDDVANKCACTMTRAAACPAL